MTIENINKESLPITIKYFADGIEQRLSMDESSVLTNKKLDRKKAWQAILENHNTGSEIIYIA